MPDVPQLTGKRLRLALKAIDRLPINQRAKANLKAILIEAALPDRHDPAHAAGRRHGANMRATEAAMIGLSRRHMTRAGQVIDAGPEDDDAWMDMVEKGLHGE